MLSAIASSVFYYSLACTAPSATVSMTGHAVLGFERSYFVPNEGSLRGRKLWLVDANLLSSHFDARGKSGSIWRRGKLSVQGCLSKGRFGHLGAYRYQLSRLKIVQ